MTTLVGQTPGEAARVRGRSLRPGAVAVAALAIGLLATGAAIGTAAAFSDRALPGLTVAGVPVGTLERAEVRAQLAAALTAPLATARVTASAAGRSWTATNAELGITPDLDAATGEALVYGKTGDPLARAAAWIAALRGEADVAFSLRAEGDALPRFVARVAADIDARAIDGEIRLSSTGLELTEPRDGRALDRTHAAAALTGAHALGDRSVDLVVRPVHPAVDTAGYADAAAKLQAATTELEVSHDGRGVREDRIGLGTLIDLRRVAAAVGDLPPIPADSVAPAFRYRYTVALDEVRARAWAAAVAAVIDAPAKNATYTVAPTGALVVVPSRDGARVDQNGLVRALADAIFRGSNAPRILLPPVAVERPVFTTEKAQTYAGSMERTSSFETFFPPSVARWKNISVGAAQFNDIVIGPGETFSFWELLGPVTVERGYALAGAIIDGRSRDDVIGGGLCQVSTTLFNAIARVGYEIVERGAHAYYIDRYPLGLDAAVFEPGLDLKWRNDTDYPVLLRSSTSNIAVEFEIFTVPTGRTVTFSEPVQTNIRDVMPGQFADPAFPPGAKVLGRTVNRTRTVVENGKVIHRDTFVSYYAPVWGGPLPEPVAVVAP